MPLTAGISFVCDVYIFAKYGSLPFRGAHIIHKLPINNRTLKQGTAAEVRFSLTLRCRIYKSVAIRKTIDNKTENDDTFVHDNPLYFTAPSVNLSYFKVSTFLLMLNYNLL